MPDTSPPDPAGDAFYPDTLPSEREDTAWSTGTRITSAPFATPCRARRHLPCSSPVEARSTRTSAVVVPVGRCARSVSAGEEDEEEEEAYIIIYIHTLRVYFPGKYTH